MPSSTFSRGGPAHLPVNPSHQEIVHFPLFLQCIARGPEVSTFHMLTEELASQGYVVVAVDHPGSASAAPVGFDPQFST